MSKDKKTYKLVSEADLKRYLEKDVSAHEAHEIEYAALHDPFQEEALEGWEQNNPKQISDDLDILRVKLASKQAGSNNRIWMRVAAIGLLLLVGSYMIWVLSDSLDIEEELAVAPIESSEEQEEPLDSPSEKSEAVPAEPTLQEEAQVVEVPKPEESTEEMAETEFFIAEAAVEEVFDQEEDIIIEDQQLALNEVPQVESLRLANDDLEETNDFKPEILKSGAKQEPNTISGIDIRSQTSFASRAKSGNGEPFMARESASRKIYGVVLDKGTSQPISGMSVIAKGTSSSVTTNESGEYEIDILEGDEDLVFAHSGYDVEEKQLSKDDTLNVSIGTESFALEELAFLDVESDEEEKEIEIVYMDASPVEGMRAYKVYLKESKIYPESAKQNNEEGVVRLRVFISDKGEIMNIEIRKSLSSSCDAEAIRLVNEGPKWNSAIKQDESIDSYVTLRIKFP
ncbi:MAG: TonB family protein [Cyclobacteriaceae bacterium]